MKDKKLGALYAVKSRIIQRYRAKRLGTKKFMERMRAVNSRIRELEG